MHILVLKLNGVSAAKQIVSLKLVLFKSYMLQRIEKFKNRGLLGKRCSTVNIAVVLFKATSPFSYYQKYTL